MIEKNTSYVKDFLFKEAYNYIGSIANAISATGSLRAFNINAWDGPTYPIGSQLTIGNTNSINSFNITLVDELVTGDTSISCDAINLTEDIASDSIIIVSQADWVANKYKRYVTEHLNGTFPVATSTTVNDYLGTLSQGIFNNNGGAVFSDGDNKGNNFGGRFGMMNSVGTDFRIHEIKTNMITNLPSDTTVTLTWWKKSFDPTGTSNSTLNLICTNTITGAGSFNQGYRMWNTGLESNADAQFTVNDVLIPTIKVSKTQSAAKNVYFDAQVVASTFFN